MARWLVTPADVATGSPQDDRVDADLAVLGVPAAQIAAGRAERGGADEQAAEVLAQAPGCWPWHRDAALIFRAMRRQWRVLVGEAGVVYLGLDFNALGEVRRMLRIRPRPELMDQLETMQAAGAEALNDLD